jgi:hypothetical protein
MVRGELDPAVIGHLRAVLNPRREERYDFATVMNRWAKLVWDAAEEQEQPAAYDPELERLAKQLILKMPRRRVRLSTRGRPRSDLERYAALMLGLIFEEYTGKRPKRYTARGTGENSPFYRFATEAFKAIGLYPRAQAFREVSERWDLEPAAREFDEQRLGSLLWGGLTPRSE